MRLASLAMYDSPPSIAEATRSFWAFLRDALRDAGIPDVPDQLDAEVRYDAAWTHPDLLLAQTCGFPYVKHLRGKARLVATPAYDHPGCDGPLKCSMIIVRRDSPFSTLEDLRGARAAFNEPDSNSGDNLFRAMIAPLSKNGRFFSSAIETGDHLVSIDAVSRGEADVAAIDCITFGDTQHFDPERLSGVRVLMQTVKGPGLPFITRASATDDDVETLRAALRAAIAAPKLAGVRETLSLKGISVLSDADYQPLADLETEARRLGYPVIA